MWNFDLSLQVIVCLVGIFLWSELKSTNKLIQYRRMNILLDKLAWVTVLFVSCRAIIIILESVFHLNATTAFTVETLLFLLILGAIVRWRRVKLAAQWDKWKDVAPEQAMNEGLATLESTTKTLQNGKIK